VALRVRPANAVLPQALQGVQEAAMIEKWARVPVALCVVAVCALAATMLLVGGFVLMMAGPEDAR